MVEDVSWVAHVIDVHVCGIGRIKSYTVGVVACTVHGVEVGGRVAHIIGVYNRMSRVGRHGSRRSMLMMVGRIHTRCGGVVSR